eukprot:m.46540 g.46540  ORF g.46540 m.46540 type:complete len:388 (-) comp10724_c0_seq1:110-1273(-)
MEQMRVLLFLVAVVVFAAPVCGETLFTVVSSPSYIEHSDEGTVSYNDVANLISNGLGLHSDSVSSALTKTSPFESPKASLHIEFVGDCAACVPENSEVTFDTFEAPSQSPFSLLAQQMQSTFGYSSVQHCKKENGQVDVSVLAEIEGVDVSTSHVSVGGMSVESSSALVSELVAVVTGVNSAISSSQRPILVLASLNVVSSDAASNLTRAVLAHVSSKLSSATNQNAFVTIHTQIASAHTVARRDVDAVTGNPGLTPHDYAWVEHCEDYTCYCYADKNGKPWDQDTRCSVSCSAEEKCSDCAYIDCDCQSQYVTKTQSLCNECVDGFVLHGNHCYLDSEMPAAVNIILWLGVFLIFGLLGTCVALGYMDPGYDSIIYRMTQQRIKSQ